ncbi:MAG: hypothetical protein HQL37_03665 [Alphaproteobacteria bacterium]|nr:hypothetical protein [Alphaproteobacteria bacterium]
MAGTSAVDIEGGRLVYAGIGGSPVLCLKAIRQGKDFVNHYVVPLDPLPAGPQSLVYLDYETLLEDCHDRFAFVMGEAKDRSIPEVGDIMVAPHGTFLKLQEYNRGAFMLAYLDIAGGDLHRHKERNVEGVFGWRVIAR